MSIGLLKKCNGECVRLKSARKKAGYTSSLKASQAFGWPVGTLGTHEACRAGIAVDVARKYAAAFNVSVEWLLGVDVVVETHQKFFGHKLRGIRLRKGLSMHELGERIGVTRQRIEQLERRDGFKELATIEALANALGVEPEYFSVPDENSEAV